MLAPCKLHDQKYVDNPVHFVLNTVPHGSARALYFQLKRSLKVQFKSHLVITFSSQK